jgi:hypothetical protein
MGPPNMRFTIRSMMVAVGLVAIFLVLEPFFFRQAVELVKSHNDYLLWEAVTAWIVLNILFIGIPAAAIWDILSRRD